jgi:rubrerythrin
VRTSTRQLRRMADDVDQQHHEAMQDFREVVGEVHAPSGRSRRLFIRDLGIGSAALTMGSALVPVSRLMPQAFAQGELSDTDIAAFAQSVELAAVAAYGAAAERGLLDAATVEVATMFAGHHQDHADAFGAVAGDMAPDEANQAVLDAFGPMIEEAADAAALLQIAYDLEEGAAATYVFALGALQDPANAAATATILPVEAQHAVVLGQALELDQADYLPPFETDTAALDPAEFPVAG